MIFIVFTILFMCTYISTYVCVCSNFLFPFFLRFLHFADTLLLSSPSIHWRGTAMLAINFMQNSLGLPLFCDFLLLHEKILYVYCWHSLALQRVNYVGTEVVAIIKLFWDLQHLNVASVWNLISFHFIFPFALYL